MGFRWIRAWVCRGAVNQTTVWPRRPPVDTRNGALEAPFGTHWLYFYIFILVLLYLDQCGADGLPLDPDQGVWGDGEPNYSLASLAPC